MVHLVLILAAATPVRVAVPPLQIVGVETLVADALVDRFVTQLSSTGEVRVITARDMTQVLGVERQKQLMGCTESSGACTAELAGALGTDAVLSGSVVKVGASFTATLRFVSGSDGRELAAATTRVKTLEALQDWLDEQAPPFIRRLVAAQSGGSANAAGPSPLPWIAVGGSVVLAGAGLLSFVLGKNDFQELGTTSDPARITALQGSIPFKEQLGVGLMVGGGVALAASMTWALLRPGATVSPTLQSSAGGVTVGLQGRWP